MNATTAQHTPPAPDTDNLVALRLAQLRAVLALNLQVARRTKRILAIGLVGLMPAAPPMLFVLFELFVPGDRSFGAGAMGYFRNAVVMLYLHVVLYVFALAYGLAIISDDVEGKTLIHLMLCPTPRWVIVLGKFLAAWLIAGLLMVGSLVVTYACTWAAQGDPASFGWAIDRSNLKELAYNALILVYALGAYLALFSCLGAWIRHGERLGVAFCFGWEWLITYLPARLKWYTLMYHVETLIPGSHESDSASGIARFLRLRGERLGDATCVLILLAVMILCLALTVRNLKRKEIR